MSNWIKTKIYENKSNNQLFLTLSRKKLLNNNPSLKEKLLQGKKPKFAFIKIDEDD